eukprot:g11046.t1
MARLGQHRQFVKAVHLLATFILGACATESSIRVGSAAVGRTLRTEVSTTSPSHGCFRDKQEDRVLDEATSIDEADVTPDACAVTCLAQGSYEYYAVQYGQETTCGGVDAFEIFEYDTEPPAETKSLGCFVDRTGDRVFETFLTSSGDNTPENCEASCGSGYAYFGVQYGRECFCGRQGEEYNKHGESAGGCNMDCTGDRSTTCGGRHAIEVFSIGGALPATPAPVTPAPVAQPTVTPTTPPGMPPGYLGCWRDKRERIFASGPTRTSDNTPERCQATCSEYAYFGLQNGNECFCGKAEEDYEKYDQSDRCTVACSGSDYVLSPCGGAWAMDVFATGAYYTQTTPASVKVFGGIDGCEVVIIEGEDLDLEDGDYWNTYEDRDASGGKYIVWEPPHISNTEVSRDQSDVLRATVAITVPGTYRFKWRMRQPDEVKSDQANDSWLSFPDAARFGPLGRDSIYVNFVKVYGNAHGGVFEYSGRADVDHVYTEVAVEFEEPGWYEMEIAGRSPGHEIDQIILFEESLDVDEAAARGCSYD